MYSGISNAKNTQETFKILSNKYFKLSNGNTEEMDKKESIKILNKIIKNITNNQYKIDTKEKIKTLSSIITEVYYDKYFENKDMNQLLSVLKESSLIKNNYELENYYLISGFLIEDSGKESLYYMKYYNDAIKLAIINKNKIILFDTYTALSTRSLYNKEYYESMNYLEKASNNITRVEDEIFLGILRTDYFYALNIYDLSIEENLKTYTHLLSLSKEEIEPHFRYDYTLSLLYKQILSYTKQKNYNKAIIAGKKANILANKIDDDFEKIYSLFLLNYATVKNKDIKNAKKQLIQINKLSVKFKDGINIMYNVALMNYFYNVETKDYEKAYKILKDLESFLKEKDKKSLSRIYEHLMEINFLLNKQEEAYSYQKKYIKNIEINFNERTANITNIYFSKQEKLKLIKEKKELNKILKNKNEEIAVIKIEESEINNLLKNNFIIVVLLIFFVFIMIALYIKYNKISNKDVLTNLYNRRFIKKSYKRLNIKNAEISFILIDLDYFKLINDNYGHEIGDKVIKEIAIIMNKETRSGDVLSRICGEEFLVLTKNNKKKAQNIAERLRSSIENHDFYFIEEKIKLTASFGISTSINKEKKYQKCTLNQIKIYINQNLAVGIK